MNHSQGKAYRTLPQRLGAWALALCLLLLLTAGMPVRAAAEETGDGQTTPAGDTVTTSQEVSSAPQSSTPAPEQGTTQEPGAVVEPEQGTTQEPGTVVEPEQGTTQEPGTTDPEQGTTQEPDTTDPEQGTTQEPGTTDPEQGTTQEPGTTDPEQGTSADDQENPGTDGATGEEKNRTTSTESGTVTGAGDTEDETYSMPSGSAYIFEIGKSSTYYNDANKGSAIQQGLEGALTYIGGLYESEEDTADRTATLVVSKGTYENGITLDSTESESTLGQLILDILGLRADNDGTGDKLTIRIVAEDAIEQDAEGNITGFTADGSGEVQLEGDVNILAGNLNLNLVLAGLYLSTRGLINTEDLDSLTVMGTQKDDYITISAKNMGSSVQVNTGKGDDVVKADVSGRAGVAVDMVTYIQLDILLRAVNDLTKGSLADTISSTVFPSDIFGDNFTAGTVLANLSKLQELQKKLGDAAKDAATTPIHVDIRTGDGNDKLNLNLLDSTRLESETIEGTEATLGDLLEEAGENIADFPLFQLTRMHLYVDVAGFDVNVDGGDGADRLTITGGRDSSNAYPLVKAASDYVFEEMGKEPTATITVNGGAGDDVITVDNSVLFATRGTTNVNAQGGTGFDRLHLTGVLDSSIDADQRITETVSGDDVEFHIQALASLIINDGYTTIDYKLSYPGAYQIIAKNMDAYTDTLENKRTVELTKANKTEAQKFTNYTVSPDSEGKVDIDIADYLTLPENESLRLTNILVVGEEDQQITIEKLLAKDLNVTIDADKIEVLGTILGRNILLNAYAEDKALVEVSANVTVDTGMDGETGLPGEVGIDGATLGVYEAKRTVFIKIGENAKLTAKEAVDLAAALYLYHDFVPGLELLDESNNIKFNPVTVKAGYATIEILGTVHAGGAIQIAADVDMDVDVTNGELKAVIPVAIGIIGGEAKVTVDGKADIRSGLGEDTLYNVELANGDKLPATAAGTSLRADSTLRIAAHAGSGALPISVALALVEFQTKVIVGGNAVIAAGGDLDILARNHTVTGVSVCGYEKNKYDVKIKSGVFIAGTYADLSTEAVVQGNASLRSHQGSVDISGVSRMHNTTVSVAVPATDADGELTLLGAVKILNDLVDLGGVAKSVIPTLLEKAGLNKLNQLFSKATESSGEDGGKTSQCLGAFAWAYVETTANGKINTTGTVQAAKALNLYALDELRSEVRADGSLYKTTSYGKAPDNAIGAGLALAILEDKAEASIEKGTIIAGGLDIRALLGDCVSTVVAKSGHVPEDAKLGLAGAVAVQLTSFENTAAVNSGVIMTLADGSSVIIRANGSGWFVTVGDASGKRQRLSLDLGAVNIPLKSGYEGSGDSTAIGAGIAVDTIRVNSWAGIEDGVTITVTGDLAQLLVSADFAGDHYVEAAAGAKGGTSAVPVVALSLSGMDINAYIGSGAAVLPVAGDVTVTASGTWERTLISDGETGGVKVGIGAAVGVVIASDHVQAELNRSVTAENIIVEAESISRVTETVKASAKGVTANKGSGTYGQGDGEASASQKDVEDALSGTTTSKENLTVGGTDSTINKLVSTLSGLAAKLPAGGSKNNQSGNLDPSTVDGLGKSRPAAGTSEGNVEVAAAIAVNVQSNTVSARIGNGLTITTTGDVAVNSRQDTDATVTANGSAVKSTTGVGVAVAVNYVCHDNRATIGTSRLTVGGDLTVQATIVEDAQKRAVEEILAELVKYFADENGIDFLLNAAAEKQDKTAEELKAEILEKYCTDYEKMSDAQKKAVAAEVTKMLQASLSGDPVGTSVTLAGDVLDDILAAFRELFSDPQFFLSILVGDGEAGEQLEEIFAGMKLDGKITLSTIRELLSVALTEKFGNPSELDGVGNRITTVSISGEGAANVGVAGSVAVACVDGTTLASIEGQDKAANQDITVVGVVTIRSDAAQKVYTTATASAVANGAPNKNTNKSGSTTSVGVGASFAMSLANISSKAILGNNRSLTAKALGVKATAQNDVDTIAVAGQDPIGVQQEMATTTPKAGETQQQANNSTADDIGADAAVALTILSNTVYAQVCPGCKLTLTGGDLLNTDLEQGDAKTDTLYGLVVDAYQRGQTLTSSSGFASAKKGAVGASVALNIASSDVLASLNGSGTIGGKTLVQAETFNEDEVKALAVVTGVKLDRYLQKIRSAMNTLNTTDRPSTGSINAKVVNALNGKAGEAFSSGANSDLPLSGVLSQKLNITLPDTKTDDKAQDALDAYGKDSDGKNLGGQQYDNPNKGQSINIAAAIGINVTNHQSKAELNGNFTTGETTVAARNRGNFLTTGSGATVTVGDKGANNISAGIAVSVNKNVTDSSVAGTLRAPGGVSVKADATQNMDGKYPGLLAAQAIAGSVGGTNAKVGLAGAIAVVVAQAQTRAHIAPGTVINTEEEGAATGDVRVESTDKSKLALRAGSVMLGGAKVGMGASFGVLYGQNGVYADVGDGCVIRAKDMFVSATREKVTTADYVFPFDLSTLFTVNVPDTDKENKGFININISDGQGESKLGDNSVEVNLSVADIQKVLDLLNYGTMANYYVETIAGSIPGQSTLGLAGAISMIYATAETEATIGEDCQITLDGELKVEAENQTQVRQISGAATAAGRVGVGVNMTGYVNQRSHTTLDENGNEITKTLTDQTLAAIGRNTTVTAPNGILVSALADTNVLAATIAAAATTTSGTASIGGSLSTIAAGNVVKAIVGEKATLTAAKGDISVNSSNTVFLLPISASVAGGVSKVAPGGTFSAIVVENQTESAMGNGVKATAGQSITLSAVSEETLINWLNAAAISNGSSVAATIGVLVTNSQTTASVGKEAVLTAQGGTIEVHAKGDVFQVVVLTGVAGGSQVSAGAIVNVSVFNRKVQALVGAGAKLLASELAAGRNVLVLAEGKDRAYLISASGSASTSGAAVEGNITVVVSNSTILASVGDNANIKAGDTVVVYADLDSDVIHGAVNVPVSGGSVAVGATTSTLVVKNDVQALIGERAKIIACAAGKDTEGGFFAQNNSKDKKRKGIFLKANAGTRLVQATASAGGATSAAVCGVVNTLVIQNHVLAQAGKGVVMSAGYDCDFASFPDATSETEEDGSDGEGDSEPPYYNKKTNENAEVAVEASGDSEVYAVSGAVSGAGSVGVGASVVTLVVGKQVEALVGEDSFLQATGNVTVTANSEDKNVIVTVSVSAGGNTSVGAGVSTLVYDNSVTASLDGTIYSGGNVTVDADSDVTLSLAACDVAAAGTAAVAGGSNALVSQSKVLAQLGGSVTAAKDVSVTSRNEVLLVNVAGAAGGSGTVTVLPVAVVTTYSGSSQALLLEGTDIYAKGSFTLEATSKETMTADAIGAGGSGVVGVSGAVVVSVSQQTTRAMAQADVSVTATAVTVKALDTTKFITAVGTVVGSSEASVGVIASVTVLHNTVEAGFTGGTDANKNTVKSTTGDVTIAADAQRDIRAYALDASASGIVAVSPSVMVLVTGGKLDQDSATILGESFQPDAFAAEHFGEDKEYLAGYEMNDLAEKLEGDGQKYSDIQIGDDTGKADFDTGYTSEDFTDSSFDDNGETGRGENIQIDAEGNETITGTGNILSTRPSYDPKDAVKAIIGSGVHVTSAKDIQVSAEDLLQAELFNTAISGSGIAAVGTGMSVAVLYSNVVAGVDAGTELNAKGHIRITAESHSVPYEDNTSADTTRNDYLSGQTKSAPKITERTIRVVSIAASGAIAGVSVVGSVVSLSNTTIAYMDGKVTGAQALTVQATMSYPNTLAVTGAGAGGAAGITASFAIALTQGKLEASIGGSADISGVTTITVHTDATFDATAVSAALAVGGVAVNGGVALSVNRLQSNTFVGPNVKITGATTLNVTANHTTTANVYLLNVAGGSGEAAGISAVVAIVAPTIHTYIGVAPDSTETASGTIAADTVKVTNTVKSEAKPDLAFASAGSVAITGAVIVVINDTDAITGILRKDVEADTIYVSGDMDASAGSDFTSANVGSVSIGASIAYVQLRADNKVLLDITGALVKADDVTVKAQSKTKAIAKALVVNAGMVTVNVNTAIADNRSANLAQILGAGTLTLEDDLEVLASGTATAQASITGLSLGALLNVNGSIAVAVLRNQQKAMVDGGNISAKTITVTSKLNESEKTAESDRVTAKATISVGSGGMKDLAANIAVAYGLSESIARIQAGSLTATGALNVSTSGNAGTQAKIDHISGVSSLTGTVMAAFAYAQGKFEASIVDADGKDSGDINAGDISAKAENIQTFAIADVTPSVLDVRISGLGIQANLAVASAKANILAQISRTGQVSGSAVTVLADTVSYARAAIQNPTISLKEGDVAANVSVALLKTTQKAAVGGKLIQANGKLSVISYLNKDFTGNTAEATAEGNKFGASILEAKLNVMIAKSKASSTAAIEGGTNVSGILLWTEGKSTAYAAPGGGSSVSFVGVGINQVFAEAAGTFQVLMNPNGQTIHAGADGIDVQNRYTAKATAVSGQPKGGVGVNVAYATAQTNVASAKTNVKASALLKGKGTISTDGDLMVTAIGNATANATINKADFESSAISVAANVALATVGGTQSVEIQGDVDGAKALLTVSAKKRIKLDSQFNYKESDTSKSYDATATVGSNSGERINMSYAGLEANKATAKMEAEAKAAIRLANVIAGYALQVQTLGSSRAKANVDVGTTVSAMNVSVIQTDAQAMGSFTAEVELGTGNLNVGYGESQSISGETLKQGDVLVKVDAKTDAQATTANAGGAIDIASLKTNEATANAGSTTTAGFGGNGLVKGDVTVKALGNVIAKAVTEHPKITISGVDLTVNKTTATSTGTQTAKIDANGSLTVNGDIGVTSTLTSFVTSDVGGASADKSLEFHGISGKINESTASGSTQNSAFIASGADGSSITANAITLNATTTSKVTATTKQGISTSLASFGGLTTSAYTQDQVSAHVGGTTTEETTAKGLMVNAYSLTVSANNNAEASAESNAVGSAALVTAHTSKSQAGVGTQNNKQTAQAGIGDKVAITLDGDLKVYAGNFGTATAALKKGAGVAITSFTDSELPTRSYYLTRAYVGDGTSITAGGQVDILSEDTGKATSDAVSSTISFAVSTATVYGNNTINTDNTVAVGASGIFATEDITIKASSSVTMYARTVADTKGGFTSKADLTAKNILNRTTTASIGDNASIESDFGDVEILAQAGTGDNIETQTRLEGLAFTDFKKTSAKSTIHSTSQVLVGSARITDTFGTVHIWADAAMGRFYSKVYAYASGLGAEPSATIIDVLSLVTRVKIAGTSSAPAELTARNLEIHTTNSKLNIESFAEASGKALGANVDAKSELTVLLNGQAVWKNGEPEKENDVNKWTAVTDSGVSISNALLRGYDYVNVTATSAPEYRARNIYGHSKIFLGAIGEGTARTDLLIVSNNSVNIGTGVTVYSANATIRATQFSGTTDYKRETSGFIVKNTAGKETKTFQTTTTVNAGTKFYIGDAAAGIVIDIYKKDGKTQVRQVGIKDERSIWTIDDTNHKVTFQRIANNKAGYLIMDVTSGSYSVYDQHFIPYVYITNHTDNHVELAGLTVENDNYISPRVTLGNGASYTTQSTDITRPEFTFTSYGSGNVHISGFLANPRGDVTFRWLGEDAGGNLTSRDSVTSISGGGETAPIWAHSLTVEGAKNVGADNVNRFCVWLITHDGDSEPALNQAAKVKVDASGNVYLQLTPALLKMVASDAWESLTTSTDAFAPNMDISHIAAGGVADILLAEGRRVYQKAGTSTVTMPIPGTLEYITDAWVGLESSVTLTDRTKLEYYLESTDLATGVSVYYLPNGTRIFTNADGEIIRIQEGGIDFGLADYSYDPETNTVTLAEGVSFDLTKGTLSVLEGYSYEALLSAIDGEWLMSHINDGTFQFLYRDPNEKQTDALKLKKDENGDYVTETKDGKKYYVTTDGKLISEETFESTAAKVTTITQWYTSGSVTYYYVAAGNLPGTLISAAEGGNKKTYILAYDSNAKTVTAYLMTAQGNGGNSETNRENFVFHPTTDSYYTNKGDQDTITYWDEELTVIIRNLKTATDSNGNKISVPYILVENGGTQDDPALTINPADNTYTFTNFLNLGSGISIRYNETDKKWQAVQGTTTVDLSEVKSFGDGAFGVSPDATSTNALAKTVYETLGGKYWKVTREDGPTYSANVCVWNGKPAENGERTYYWWNGKTLYSYYYTYTYASLEEIGLILSPVGGTTSTGGPTHNITFDSASQGKLLIQDKAENVQVKAVAIPATTLTSATTGYRVTDTLYIQSAGDGKGTAILKKDDFTAIYNSGSGVYESDRIKATDLVRGEDDLVYMPTITLKKTDSSTGETQTIMLESITGTDVGCIARDMLGNYYIRTSDGWKKMTISTTEENKDGVSVDKTLEKTVDNATVVTTTLSYGGKQKLTIVENQITLSLVGETKDHGILAMRTVNGEKEYYLLRNGVWTSVQEYQAEDMVDALTASTSTLTMTVSTYITLESGTIVGSDGTVETGTKPTEEFETVAGTKYSLGDITGSSVIIRMPDAKGSLLDGNDTPPEQKTNITATEGGVTFVTASSGSIGTADDPLEIQSAGPITFQDLEGNTSLETDVFLNSDKDIHFAKDIVVDGTGKEGQTQLVANAGGSIWFGNMTVKKGGYVNLTAAQDIVSGKTLDISSDTEKASLVNMVSSGGSIALGDVKVSGNSKLTLTGAQNVTLEDADLTGSSLTATAGQDISFRIIEAVGSKLTLNAGGNIGSDGYLYFRKNQSQDAKLTLTAGGDIGSEGNYLLLDTDDTLYIPKVDNYYIDAVELVGEAFQRTPPVEQTGTGRDENGNIKAGVLLQPGAATDTVYGELGIQANTVLAEMVVDRSDRSDWVTLLGTEALVSLIRDGHITGQTLESLLTSDTFTADDIDRLLTQGDDIQAGQSGYEQLAQMLTPLLTDDSQFTNETLAAYLTQSLTDDTVDIDEMARILSGIVTEEELAGMLEAAWSHADYDSHKEPSPNDPDPRALVIEVGEATGAAFVRNAGDITITQSTGTLTAGAIHSDRRDVTLTAQTGGIEGNGDELVDVMGENITLWAKNGVGATTPLTTEQRVNRPTLVGNVTGPENTTIKPLDADGNPTSEEDKALRPWVDWGLEKKITFDWIRTAYEAQATRLNITAGGDVNIREKTGDLGLGVIRVTNGNLTLTAPGSILDNREESQTGNNLTVTGDVTLTAKEGQIGTPTQWLTTDAGGTITATAQGDISIRDQATLDLIANSTAGQVNASAENDLTLRNDSGDLVIGPITAGGTATITAVGNLVEGDRYGAQAQVTANTIVLTANGNIGTEEDHLDVDTDSTSGGTLTATGDNLYIREVDGDLLLKKITSTGDTTLTAPGSILDTNKNLTDKAVEAQKEASNAKAEADQAQAEAYVKQEQARLAEEAVKKAQKALDKAEAMKDPEAKKKALEKAEKALAEATADYDAAQAAADAAQTIAEQKRKDAEAKQAQADAAADAARSQETTITTGGDLTLNAGGNIGADDGSLSAQVGGSVDANGKDTHIAGQGDLNFRETQTTGTVEISTAGGTITSDGTITAGTLDVSALGGDVGKADDYLSVSTDRLDALGDNVYIRNDKDTPIGQIIAGEDVKLDSQGNVTGDPATQPNIIAKDITINAKGDIGTKEDPLDISGEAFHGTGGDIYLDNHTQDLDISGVKSDKLDVTTDGNVTGKDNEMHDIRIDADGKVGTPEEPFTFTADGIVNIHGDLGTWYRNLFVRAETIGIRKAILVLRFDLSIAGENYSLYVLLEFRKDGTGKLLGRYLCKGAATESFWAEILTGLKADDALFLFEDEPELEKYLKARGYSYLDASHYGLTLEEALMTFLDDASALHQTMEDLERRIRKAAASGFPTREAAQEALEAALKDFPK